MHFIIVLLFVFPPLCDSYLKLYITGQNNWEKFDKFNLSLYFDKQTLPVFLL